MSLALHDTTVWLYGLILIASNALVFFVGRSMRDDLDYQHKTMKKINETTIRFGDEAGQKLANELYAKRQAKTRRRKWRL